jgi:flagellar hook-basal body complex protein FliE
MGEILNAMADQVSPAPSSGLNDITLPAVTPEVELDGSRLSDILANQLDQPVIATDPTMMSGIADNNMKNLGEVLLKRLDVVGNNFTKSIERTNALLNTLPSDLRVQDVMKLQLEMASVSLEVELVGKGVQKAVQHIDQLTKLQ